MKLKNKGKLLFLILTTLGLLLVAFAWIVLDRSLAMKHRGQDVSASYDEMRATYPTLGGWLDSLSAASALKDTFITAEDGARLHAYYVRAAEPTAKTSVIVHGYTDNAVRMMMIGEIYHRHLHYNVLLPDLRFAGDSEGTHIQMGWLDRLDVGRWVRETPHLFGDSVQVVVHGISMGAATTMMYSGEDLPEYVRAFVPDCGYTSVWDQFSYRLKVEYGLPAFPILSIADLVSRCRYGWGFEEASALVQVAKCDRPMFFIHGEADDYVPTAMVYRLYEAKQGVKDLWIAPGSAHATSYLDHPEEYIERVRTFVDTYVK